MDIYGEITDLVISKLDGGIIPWEKGWAETGAPKNIASNKQYYGINTLLLSMMGYSSNIWGTYNQIKQKGGQVKRGEKSTPIVYFDFVKSKYETVTDKDGNEKPKIYPMLKRYSVFNILQSTLTPPTQTKVEHKPIKEVNILIKKYVNNKVNFIRQIEQRAYYKPSEDFVNMPILSSFKKVEIYYSTLFHELTHSTGHATRLSREGITSEKANFGNHLYSKEELVAEMGSCFLNSMVGITSKTIDNNTAYIQSWIKALKNDKKMLVSAGSKAQKAVNYIINFQTTI